MSATVLTTWLLLAGASAAPAERAPAPEETAEQERARVRARARERMLAVRAAGAALRDYVMIMEMAERTDGRMPGRIRMLLKWARPNRVYVRYLSAPHAGREVLWSPGRNRGRLLVHKGSFPDLNINLDPFGSIAMNGNHHPVSEVSLAHFAAMLVANLELAMERDEGDIELVEGLELWGRACTKLVWRVGRGGWLETLDRGQTLWDVARKTGRDMYVILHHNRHQGWCAPDDPRPGDRVFVPRYYAGRAEIWLDDRLDLPIKARFWDYEGQLYEAYDHLELQINVGLTERDFDPDNPEYDF